jgi:hypothetical protein
MIAQNWDVYAPGFRMLLQNEEYIESETEFDVNPKEGEDNDRQSEEPESVRHSYSNRKKTNSNMSLFNFLRDTAISFFIKLAKDVRSCVSFFLFIEKSVGCF